MDMKNKVKLLGIIFSTFVLLIGFQNCGSAMDEGDLQAEIDKSKGQGADGTINCLAIAVPERIGILNTEFGHTIV